MTLTVLLLAAGLSRRFGEADKLAARWGGGCLAEAAAGTARRLGADRLLVVVGPDGAAPDGFEPVVNPAPEDGLGSSLSVGARAACGADRLLVLLADMPLVTAGHCRAVVAWCTDERPAASTDGRTEMPPACFPAPWLDRLATASGEGGARTLLQALPPGALVAAPAGTLADVDTPSDLATLRGAA